MVAGSMGYPFESFDAKGQLTGGVLKELGELIAAELNTGIEFVSVSRRRVEPSLIAGESDIACNASPKWSGHAKTLQWSIPSLAQVERSVVLKGREPPLEVPDDYLGKRVSLRLGYKFATIQPLFDAGKATRLDETDVGLLFKAVETGLSDVLITSEGEIEGHFRLHPEARKRFAIASKPFSVVQTQCAVSPTSRWPLDKIDKALATLLKRGDIDRLTQRYGLSMR